MYARKFDENAKNCSDWRENAKNQKAGVHKRQKIKVLEFSDLRTNNKIGIT